MSSRRNPFDGLEELFERMSRQFESAARAWDTSSEEMPASPDEGGFGMMTTESSAGLDLADHDDEFVVTVDVPGYEKDDIDVRLTDDTLHIEGERERETDEEQENYLRRERQRRSFSRRVRLPEPVDTDEASARVQNGVLTITLGKEEPGRDSRSIEIE